MTKIVVENSYKGIRRFKIEQDNIDLSKTTIAALKSLVHSASGIAPRHQKLIVLGRLLGPDYKYCSSLWDYSKAQTIHLVPNGPEAFFVFQQQADLQRAAAASSTDQETATTDCSSEQDATINVSIESLTGAWKTLITSPDATVESLWRQYRDLIDFRGPNRCLTYRGTLLRHIHFALSDYGITEDGSRIYQSLPSNHFVRDNGWYGWSEAHSRRAFRIASEIVKHRPKGHHVGAMMSELQNHKPEIRLDFLFTMIRSSPSLVASLLCIDPGFPPPLEPEGREIEER